MCLACRQAESDREPLRINDRVDFGRKPASGATETMICVCVMSAFDTKRTCQSCCSMSAFGGILLQNSAVLCGWGLSVLIVGSSMRPFEGAAASLAAADATLTPGKQRAAVAGRGRAVWQAASGSARLQ